MLSAEADGVALPATPRVMSAAVSTSMAGSRGGVTAVLGFVRRGEACVRSRGASEENSEKGTDPFENFHKNFKKVACEKKERRVRGCRLER